MRLKLPLLAALAALVAACAVTAGTASAATAATAATPPNAVTISPTQSGGHLDGVFTITRFTRVAGVLTAVGTFTGTADGNAADGTPASAPVAAIGNHSLTTGATSALAAQQAADPSCQILDLTLGPLSLDLLGLQVNLNQVHLNITAQSGPGNLLGNLLCAVAHLLDNTGGTGGSGLSGLLQGITNLLNQILAAL